MNCSHNSIQQCQYNKDANVQCPSKLYSCCNISNYVIVPDTTDNCTYGEIRLINGQSQYEGLVEICNNGRWEFICTSYWDSSDAKVACRQLGYTDIGKYIKDMCNTRNNTSYITMYHLGATAVDSFGKGVGPVELYYFYCYGQEKNLFSCSRYNLYSCNYNYHAGIKCEGTV